MDGSLRVMWERLRVPWLAARRASSCLRVGYGLKAELEMSEESLLMGEGLGLAELRRDWGDESGGKAAEDEEGVGSREEDAVTGVEAQLFFAGHTGRAGELLLSMLYTCRLLSL